MATLAGARPAADREAGFFLITAILMALVLVAGFSFQLAMGRSSFAAPVTLHLHAVIFFGWTALYVLQNALVATGRVSTHKRLGWIAALWVPAMVVTGTFVTVEMVRRGAAPFFFKPLYFLIMNPLSIFTFAGLVIAAIIMRRQTQWHRRLMFCAMAILMGPGFGRLLPMPLFMPWAGEAVFATLLVFPLAGMIRDLLRDGRIHRAWLVGVGVIAAMQLTIMVVSNSAIGLAIYAAAVEGHAGAAVAPTSYAPPPL